MSETREDAPIKTVTVRGEEIHPACMTANEALMTIMLNFEAGEGDCPRCGYPLNSGADRDLKGDQSRDRVCAEGERVCGVIEEAIFALLPIVPVTGSYNSGYRVNDCPRTVLKATPEEWADAAQAVCDLHALVNNPGSLEGESA